MSMRMVGGKKVVKHLGQQPYGYTADTHTLWLEDRVQFSDGTTGVYYFGQHPDVNGFLVETAPQMTPPAIDTKLGRM